MSKGAIVPSDNEPGQFISTLFIVPKPNGKFRPVINLKHLNQFVYYEHFKQETFTVVLDLVQRNDYFTSLDLCDAYFSIFVNEDFQRFLKFYWQGKLYKFICVPFGYSMAPRLFTKLLKPIFAWFRHQGFRCSYYIDDSLNMDHDRNLCRQNTLTMAETMESLGFMLNKEKSVLEPTQKITYFGYILDSVLFKVFLPDKKIQKIKDHAKVLLSAEIVTLRSLASFIGMIINAFHAILEAPLHYRILEREKISGLGSLKDFEQKIRLSEYSKCQLRWWIENVEARNGKLIRPQKPSVFLQTDASLMGWGCYNTKTGVSIGVRWNKSEDNFPINYLELLAIFHSVRAFCSDTNNVHVSIQSDSTTAIAYVNNMGGIASISLDQLALELWQWCLDREIYMSASFIPGVFNVTADFNSRNFSDSTEWMLKKELFERLCDHFFQPDVDLFASRNNHQIDKFVSWFPQPGAWQYDAFSFSWKCLKPYIFAPFSLISRVLNKIVEDKVEKALLVIPHWTSQSWFPFLLSLMVSFPVRIPRHKDALTLPHSGQPHPLGRSLSLVGVLVSGDVCRCKDFHQMLSTLSDSHGEPVPRNSIHWPGGNGVFGLYKGNSIRFVLMK
ncbi:MAG: hypothetical protein JAZ17_12090 [Candidatus Thiodiazotropha endolucinida]|nr:hypothetical protein [Candidatus Thiodiazotropha endolucinida]